MDKPLTQDHLADLLTQPVHALRGDNEMYIRVLFFRRKEDGTTERVYTAGSSPAVPITYISGGIDWDMNRTFANTAIPVYADWDEWRAYLHEGREDACD